MKRMVFCLVLVFLSLAATGGCASQVVWTSYPSEGTITIINMTDYVLFPLCNGQPILAFPLEKARLLEEAKTKDEEVKQLESSAETKNDSVEKNKKTARKIRDEAKQLRKRADTRIPVELLPGDHLPVNFFNTSYSSVIEIAVKAINKKGKVVDAIAASLYSYGYRSFTLIVRQKEQKIYFDF